MGQTLITLYKRAKTRIVQYWSISVEAAADDCAVVTKESGQVNTVNPLIHQEILTEGKNIGRSNSTTPYQQACLEAAYDHKRKQDAGYKTLAQYGIDVLFDDKADISGYKIISTGEIYPPNQFIECLDRMLPDYNSDASGNVLPMLAPSKCWAPGNKKDTWPKIAEIKYDGNRSTLVMSTDDTYALTRTGKPQKNLGHLIKILDEWYPIDQRLETIVLDGEIYIHGLPLEEINEAIKAENENTPRLGFIVYDLPLHTGIQIERSAEAASLVMLINNPLFEFSPQVIVHNDQEVAELLREKEDEGYEGLILKDPNGVYQQGQRSNYWRKVKTWEDNEFVITGHVLGQRGAQDLKFVCETTNGQKFEVTMNGSVATKERLYSQVDSYTGKKLTVKHKGYTKYGIPNHAKGKAIYNG